MFFPPFLLLYAWNNGRLLEDYQPYYEWENGIHILKMAKQEDRMYLGLQWHWSEAVCLRKTYNSNKTTKKRRMRENERERERDLE